MFRLGLFSSIVFVISFFVGAAFGSALTVSVAYAATEFVLTWPGLFLSGRLIGLSLGTIIGCLKDAALCSGIMGGAIWLVVNALSSRVAAPTQLVAGVLTGIVAYAGLSLVLQRRAIADLQSMIRKRDP